MGSSHRAPFARRAVVAGCVVVAMLAAASCTGDDDASSTPARSTSTSSSGATTTTAPCTPAAGFTPGTTRHALVSGGTKREFLVHLPPQPTGGMALVVDFHGAGSDMVQQDIYSGFDALADADGFVVASPNGVDAAIRQWRFLGTMDDVDFAKALAQELVRTACIDATRVYAVGISSGSAMSASLACQASDVFHGFGLVAGNFYFPAICGKAARRPIIIFHGTADPVVPYNGGPIANSGLPVMGEEQTAKDWAAHNGCTSGPTETAVGSEVVRLDWSGCAEPVVMYRIVGGGHTWPGAAIDIARLGKTTHQVRATDEMWKLFAASE